MKMNFFWDKPSLWSKLIDHLEQALLNARGALSEGFPRSWPQPTFHVFILNRGVWALGWLLFRRKDSLERHTEKSWFFWQTWLVEQIYHANFSSRLCAYADMQMDKCITWFSTETRCHTLQTCQREYSGHLVTDAGWTQVRCRSRRSMECI